MHWTDRLAKAVSVASARRFHKYEIRIEKF